MAGLSPSERVHIVGIGGAGMSALASLLLESGCEVSGSDLKDSGVLERLRALGARVWVGHDPSHVAGAEVVCYSSAIPESNVELRAARAEGLRILSRAELLVALTDGRRVVAISGTHGKTTTTAMIAFALVRAGLGASYVIGAELNEAGASGHFGPSDLMVVEADESDGTFLRLRPEVAVVTNVEADHLDFYGSLEALEEAFGQFMDKSRLPPVVCLEDPIAARLARGRTVVGYGFGEDAEFQIKNLVLSPESSAFELFRAKRRLGSVELAVLGVHNVLNATAAVATAMSVGAEFAPVAEALGRYLGVARRFQRRRVIDEVRIIDDYAHLPAEIRSTLAAARQLGARRIVAVFQPHRYSRTRHLAAELGRALSAADLAVVTDVYPAGEDPIPGVTGELVWRAAVEVLGDRAIYCPERPRLAPLVRSLLEPEDVCLTLGAGDITMLESELGALR
jgi:UDP-N-acetylmuramate--alanine ligase